MGRPQSFDTPAIIRSARSVFWAQGYESASLPDLERATGLRRSSIYHAFGSKRGLFDAAISSYLDEVIHPLLSPLQSEGPSPDAVENYLVLLRAGLTANEGSLGCLLLRAAASPIGQDPEIAGIVSGYRRELTAALVQGVRARHPEVAPDAVAHLASILTALVITAMTLAPVDREAAIAAIDTARGVNVGGVVAN